MMHGSSKVAVALAVAGLLAAAAAAEEAPKLQTPVWAYAVPVGPAVPASADDGTLLSLPGSTRRYTRTQVSSEWAPKDIPGTADWYPGDHPAMPKIVAEGDQSRGIRACSLCHLPNGKGRPENAPVAGLSKAYILEQLNDMAAGTRHSAEPLKANAVLMAGYAKLMTEAEKEESAAYFAAMPWTPWIKVVESATVPKMRSQIGLYVPLTGPDAGVEPIAGRLIETPADVERSERLRDPHSPFLAYVPAGSVSRGKAVASGLDGRTLACATCHGADLNGVGSIPGLAGRSPSYIARQLNDFQKGARHGTMAALMSPVVAKLTPDDMLNVSAYLASLP